METMFEKEMKKDYVSAYVRVIKLPRADVITASTSSIIGDEKFDVCGDAIVFDKNN